MERHTDKTYNSSEARQYVKVLHKRLTKHHQEYLALISLIEENNTDDAQSETSENNKSDDDSGTDNGSGGRSNGSNPDNNNISHEKFVSDLYIRKHNGIFRRKTLGERHFGDPGLIKALFLQRFHNPWWRPYEE